MPTIHTGSSTGLRCSLASRSVPMLPGPMRAHFTSSSRLGSSSWSECRVRASRAAGVRLPACQPLAARCRPVSSIGSGSRVVAIESFHRLKNPNGATTPGSRRSGPRSSASAAERTSRRRHRWAGWRGEGEVDRRALGSCCRAGCCGSRARLPSSRPRRRDASRSCRCGPGSTGSPRPCSRCGRAGA